jgi:hypothetical protein
VIRSGQLCDQPIGAPDFDAMTAVAEPLRLTDRIGVIGANQWR